MKDLRGFVSWTFVLLWMALIFYLSHQPGDESASLSGGVMEFALGLVNSFMPGINLADVEWVHTFIRKGAHFGAYFILGILVVNAVGRSGLRGRNRIFLAISICVVYAISDEFHQLFIPGRSGQVSDVLIDSLGTCAGIFFFLAIARLSKKSSAKNGAY
ncbi:VanZ family protein [Bacillus sp. JCM 19041]|uniref:VanZ family protein n=1 Tax=Bacillus sp. JCM 19041 TaxID=1460637 RepID=UPI0006D22C77